MGALRRHAGRIGIAQGCRGIEARVVDRHRRRAALDARQCTQRDLRAVGAWHEKPDQIGRVALAVGRNFENDLVLVALAIDRRDLPLAVAIGERCINGAD